MRRLTKEQRDELRGNGAAWVTESQLAELLDDLDEADRELADLQAAYENRCKVSTQHAVTIQELRARLAEAEVVGEKIDLQKKLNEVRRQNGELKALFLWNGSQAYQELLALREVERAARWQIRDHPGDTEQGLIDAIAAVDALRKEQS